MADGEWRAPRLVSAPSALKSGVAPVWDRFTWLRRRLGASLEGLVSHIRPLLVLSALLLLAQAIFIAHHPVTIGSTDSDEYMGVARNILAHGRFVDPLRTPGYPLLLALVFLLRGGADLSAVVAVQIGLTVAAAYQIYLLAYRLTKHPWLACALAALVGANIFVLDWEFGIRSETLAYWTLITIFLVAERLLIQLRWGALLIFSALLFFAILVRPFDLLLLAILMVALMLRGIWMGQAREHLLRLGAALLIVYGCVAGYIALNGALTGYSGLSYASNVNIFGKVIEYRLQDLPVSPELTPVQRDTAQFVRDQGPGPWILTGRPWEFARAHGYDRDYYEPVGAYGRYVALHYPERYIPLTLREIAVVWLERPLAYAP